MDDGVDYLTGNITRNSQYRNLKHWLEEGWLPRVFSVSRDTGARPDAGRDGTIKRHFNQGVSQNVKVGRAWLGAAHVHMNRYTKFGSRG